MSTRKIKVLIVDDHKMIREGLRSMLEFEKKSYDFLIEEAASGEEGIEKIKKYDYDIVIMDYQLPKLNGAETTRAMLAYKPTIKILALSNYDEEAYVKNILKSGAKGYVLKNIDADELTKAITIILNEKNYYCNDVAIKLINSYEDKSNPIYVGEISIPQKITLRELEVLRLIAEAYTTKQIAEKLFISKRTVDKYRQHLLEKMEVNNTVNLLKQAKVLKLIN